MKMTPQLFLSLDLEMNQPSGRIIEVGICMGSAYLPEDEWITRKWLLQPQEPLAPVIVELTGITQEEMDARAVPWDQMARELSALIVQHSPFVNPVTWGGGDSQALLQELRSRDIALPHFGRRWLDVKTMHSFLVFASGKGNPSGGLSSVMAKHKLKFIGKPHRADVDAFNTLRLYFRLLERQTALESAASLIKNVSP